MNEAVKNTVSQGLLAKLLATENITVHVGSYKTAMFDVKNRILCLPSWNVTNKHVSDLLVGHEVGHALYTPASAIDDFRRMCPTCPFSILNIVEDVRIERLIQDRYPGLIASFNSGYTQFLADDRFDIRGMDLNSLGFADRLNLKAKCKSKVQIQFTRDEQNILDRCYAAETIEDVFGICVDIFKMIQAEPKPQPQKKAAASTTSDEKTDSEPVEVLTEEEDEDEEGDETSTDAADSNEDTDQSDEDETDNTTESESKEDSEDETQSADSDDDGESEEDTEDSEDEDSDSGVASDSDDEEADESDEDDSRDYDSLEDELNSPTLAALNSSLEELHTDFGRAFPVIGPNDDDIKKLIIPVKDVMAARIARYDYEQTFVKNDRIFADWNKFKKDTMKNIQFLITQFERKKAAFQYTRSMISDNGDIDVNRLHSYRYDDHIFRSVTKLADAKSHGMMFFIDYSRSMIYSIHEIINHTLNLVMFCKAVGIPFQVYGFTTKSMGESVSTEHRKSIRMNQLSMAHVNIFELLNSELKPKEYELACRHLRAQAFTKTFLQQPTAPFTAPCEITVATPLNETLIAAHTLVKNFRKKHNIQKMNVMILTDGEQAPSLQYGLDQADADNMKRPVTAVAQTRFQMNVGGREVSLAKCEKHNYCTLVENLKITCDCTMIGFFIAPNEESVVLSAISSIRYSRAHGWSDKQPAGWVGATETAKKKSISLKKEHFMNVASGFNYDGYIIIDDTHNSIKDAEFEPDVSDLTPAQKHTKLTAEFRKYSMRKKTNRLILNTFADLIC